MDTALAVFLHGNLHLDGFFRFFSFFGSALFLTAVVVSSTLILILFFRLHKAHIVLLSAIFSAIIGGIFKRIVARPRPDLFPPLEQLESYSFPSGHALATLVIYGILALFLAERYPKRRALIYTACAATLFFIGLSRVYLGVHWPSDVVGGWAIGAVILAAMVWWYKRGSIGRAVRIGIGFAALVVGLIGLVVPIIPGIPLLIGGAFLVFSTRSLAELISRRGQKDRPATGLDRGDR